MPSDSYKYMPFKALTQDLVLEFTLNQYAFFTSGFNEDKDGVLTGVTDLGCFKAGITQQNRAAWKLN